MAANLRESAGGVICADLVSQRTTHGANPPPKRSGLELFLEDGASTWGTNLRQVAVFVANRYSISDPGGARTHDHSIKSRMLYQLSYRVINAISSKSFDYRRLCRVGKGGRSIETPTPLRRGAFHGGSSKKVLGGGVPGLPWGRANRLE